MYRSIRHILLAGVVAGGLLLVPGESQQVEANDYWSNYWNWYDGTYRPYYRNHYRTWDRDWDRNNRRRSYYRNRYDRDYDDYGYTIGVPGAYYQRYPDNRGRYRTYPREAYQLGPLRVERWH